MTIDSKVQNSANVLSKKRRVLILRLDNGTEHQKIDTIFC